MTAATWYRARREVRAQWPAWIRLALVIGLAGTLVLATFAAADRTQSAYRRFLARTHAFDVLVINGATSPTNANRQFDFDAIARWPEVLDSSRLLTWIPVGRTTDGRSIGSNDLLPIGVQDGRFGRTLNESRLVSGRLPVAADEVAVGLAGAQVLGLAVGDEISLALLGVDQLTSTTPPPPPDPSTFRITGVVVMQNAFPPTSSGGAPPFLLLSDAYTRSRTDGVQLLSVRLRDGAAGIAAFEQALVAAGGGDQVQNMSRTEIETIVQRRLDVDATTLRVLAALVGVVALVLVGQGFARLARTDADPLVVLRALGAGRYELAGPGLVRTATVTAAGVAVAVLGAVALSPLAPVGVAHYAELDPGIAVGPALLGAAALVTLAVLALGATVVALGVSASARPHRRPATRTGWTARAAADAGAPAAAVAGLGVAAGPGEGGHPLRWSLVPVIVGVATITATLVFSASLGRVFTDPRLYGWSWDLQIGDPFSPSLEGEAAHLATDPSLAAVAPAALVRLDVAGRTVDAIGIGALKGEIAPTVVDGRAPERDDEVLLGMRTSTALGAHIGERLDLRAGDLTRSFEVVGTGVLPTFASAARLGEGAAMTLDGARRLAPTAEVDVVLVRAVPGAVGEATIDRLAKAATTNVYRPSKPTDLTALERLGGLPSLVALTLGLMGAAMVAQGFLVLVRHHRRDLAVLKVVGFRPRDVGAAVAWQVNTTVVAVVFVGVPVGLLAGRAAWTIFADDLGVPAHVVTPGVGLVAVAVGAVLVANVIALAPVAMARRTRPAVVLRTA